MKKKHDEKKNIAEELSELSEAAQPDEQQAKIADLESQLRRALADYQNLQRRVADEKMAIGKFATQAFILDLLPIVDNLDRVVLSTPEEEQKSVWFSPVAMSVAQLKELLKREGVAEISPDGEEFNGEEHEVVDVVEGEHENKVVKVHQKGYRMHEKVIRPARVQVSKKG